MIYVVIARRRDRVKEIIIYLNLICVDLLLILPAGDSQLSVFLDLAEYDGKIKPPRYEPAPRYLHLQYQRSFCLP
jgi:hypothetical protein